VKSVFVAKGLSGVVPMDLVVQAGPMSDAEDEHLAVMAPSVPAGRGIRNDAAPAAATLELVPARLRAAPGTASPATMSGAQTLLGIAAAAAPPEQVGLDE
jgi:hypothetical protein